MGYTFLKIERLPNKITSGNGFLSGFEFDPFKEWTFSQIKGVSYVLGIVAWKYTKFILCSIL
jgi:hypothetical protein